MTIHHFKLETKLSLGTLKIHGKQRLENEKIGLHTYDIGSGRITIIPKDEINLLHVLVNTEHEFKGPTGDLELWTGPILEILTEIDKDSKEIKELKCEMPPLSEYVSKKETNFFTNLCYQEHMHLESVEITITKKEQTFFQIELSAIPLSGNYSKINLDCQLKLQNKLEMFWGV